MLVATKQDDRIQKHAHLQIYDPVPRKVHEYSLVDGTWVVCNMKVGLENLPLPNAQRL